MEKISKANWYDRIIKLNESVGR